VLHAPELHVASAQQPLEWLAVVAAQHDDDAGLAAPPLPLQLPLPQAAAP
jgi:hypothetical protein